LAKVLERSYVCPYLLGVRPSDISGPLAQFQLTSATKEDTVKLLKTLNKAQGSASLGNEIIERAFDRCWPELEGTLLEIQQAPVPVGETPRSDREVLDEVLLHVRSFARTRTPSPPHDDLSAKPRGFDATTAHSPAKISEPVDESAANEKPE
jgi:hypothetical protein